MEQTLDKPDLLAQVTQGLKLQEKHLVYLELMIMEQVADWEIGTGLRKILFFFFVKMNFEFLHSFYR